MVESDSDAAAVLLRAVIDDTRAMLPTITGPIKTAWSYEIARSGRCERATVAIELHPEHGFLLAGGPHEVPGGAGDTGAFAGAALYVLSDGRLLRLRYSGAWHESHASWKARAQEISLRVAAREFHAGECVHALERALGPEEQAP